MRNRFPAWLIPVLIAGSAYLAAPATVLAADGVTERGTTTYEVVPSRQSISVSIQLSIYNGKPNGTASCGFLCTRTIDSFWNTTEIAVEVEAKSVKVSSNAGGVSQRTLSSDAYYRYIELTYPNVFYGQTRVVTVSYSIPAAPHSASSFRSGKAYASLCAVGNGNDLGSVSVIVPDGYRVEMLGGGNMPATGDSNGKQTFSTGTIAAPYKFWSCLDAQDAAAFSASTVTVSGQSFVIESWPEDLTWTAEIQRDVTADVAKEEALTGFSMPGGTIVVREAADAQLGDYAGFYDPIAREATIAEDTSPDVVAHELSHMWFNQDLFTDHWLNEGFAVYAEQVAGAGNYVPCTDPGVYPGNGSPDLSNWLFLDINSTTQDQAAVDYQYRASCYILTQLSNAIGPARLKQVLQAAQRGEIAYLGAGPAEKSPQSGPPATAKMLLDLMDERGLVPAGVTDLNKAQDLLARYGILNDTSQLDARASARTTYHELATAANGWKMPLAVRNPMASWDFDHAQTALDTIREILDQRDLIQKSELGIKLAGTTFQKQFEGARTQSDLDSLLDLTKKEADAVAAVGRARAANGETRSLLQSIGLLGTDLTPLVDRATTELKALKPDAASADAGRVIDTINSSKDQGVQRIFMLLGVLLALLLAVLILVVAVRPRRRPVVVVAPEDGGGQVVAIPSSMDGEPMPWASTPLPPIPTNVTPPNSLAAPEPPSPPDPPATHTWPPRA